MDISLSKKVFEKNLNYLSSVNPRIFTYFKNNSEYFEKFVKFEETDKDFLHVYFLHKDGNFKAIHSKVNPFREAERFVSHLEIDVTNNIIIFGLGLGYHLFEILKLKEKPEWILAVESDLKHFWAYCHINDVKELFETPGLYFLVAPSPNDIFSFLQPHSFNILSNGIKIIRHQASSSEMKSEYESLEEKINGFSEWAKASVMTQVHSANAFSKNIFQNLNSQINAIPFHNFKNQFFSIPSVIVSGGPSLSKNGHLLLKIKNKALIIAVDTALRFLNEINVEPDFVVSTDFTKNALDYFNDIKNENTILIVDSEVNLEIVNNYKGKLSFCGIEGKAILEWLQPCLGDKGDIPKGISVAHTAFSIAKYFGSNPIIFIGQDLAYTDGRTHFKGAAHGVHVNLDNSYPTVQGLFGPVKTSNSLKVFLNHFEDLFSNEKNIAIINATEGGAVIKGTVNMTFREAIIKHCLVKNSISEKLYQILNYTKNNPLSLENVKFFLNDTLKKLQPFIDSTTKVIDEIDKMIESIKNKDRNRFNHHYNHYIKLSKVLLSNHQILLLIRDNMMEAYILKAKRFKTKFHTIDDFISSEDTPSYLFAEKSYYYNLKKSCLVIFNQIKSCPIL